MNLPEPDLGRRMFQLVESFPGLHLREIARQLDLSEALAGYHLDRLVEQGKLRGENREGYRRFYPESGDRVPSSEERRLLSLLRQHVPLRIVLLLLERGRMVHPELVESVEMSKGAVSYQLGKLMQAGLVRPVRTEAGFELVDKVRVERLLKQWKPTPDVVERFAGLWEHLYAHRRRGR